MLPLLARRMQASVGSATLPWWRRLGHSAAFSHVAAAAAPSSSSSLPATVLSSGRRALATFAGGRSSSSSAAGSRPPAQQLDGSGHGGSSSSGTGAIACTSSSPNPLGVPHFEIRVYDMEEALENLTRQHSVPLGYVLPVEDSMPAPTVDAPAVVDATPLPRLAPATSAEAEDGAEGEVMQCIKRTYQPSVLKRKRAHGFLSRLKNRDGRKILGRRRLKHRSRMGV